MNTIAATGEAIYSAPLTGECVFRFLYAKCLAMRPDQNDGLGVVVGVESAKTAARADYLSFVSTGKRLNITREVENRGVVEQASVAVESNGSAVISYIRKRGEAPVSCWRLVMDSDGDTKADYLRCIGINPEGIASIERWYSAVGAVAVYSAAQRLLDREEGKDPFVSLRP